MKKYISGRITCIDNEMIEYDVRYTLVIKYNIFNFFGNFKKYIELFKNDVEFVIREKIAKSKFKEFKVENLNIDQKESDQYIDIRMTNKIRNIIKIDVLDDLSVEAKKYNFEVIDFNWNPFQICHSLAAAVNRV